METWTNEELHARWKSVAEEYTRKAKVLVPLIQHVSNLEKEMKALENELNKRGIASDKENG